MFLTAAVLSAALLLFSASATPPANLQGSFAGYFTLDELSHYLTTVQERLGTLATIPTSIGKTYGDRDILSICVGQCNDPTKPSILFTGLHHAREPMGMMAVVYTLEHLVTMYLQGDSATQSLLETRSAWFIPAVNPDGYESNRKNKPSGGGNQRKNSNTQHGSVCANSNQYDVVGVDLNRNYAACWSGDCPTKHDVVKHSDCGSSKKPCDEDYRGSAVFSEPESRAVRDFIASQSVRGSGPINIALNYHSFAKQVYMPYSCVQMISTELEEDKVTMERMGNVWGKAGTFSC